MRDRRHIDELTRFEEALPRFERTAIGVSVISRGLDDHARISGTTHKSMAAMGQLLIALATAVRATVANVLDPSNDGGLDASLEEVRTRRDICKQAASRRARIAIDHDEDDDLALAEGEWLNYAAMLVQVERMVADLSAPLPT